MRILNFNQFKLLELHSNDKILQVNKNYNLKIEDKDGLHFLEVLLESHGYSLHRHIINYEFKIIKSNTKNYLVNGRIILGLDFNKLTNQFLYYPFWFDETSKSQTTQIIKKGYLELY